MRITSKSFILLLAVVGFVSDPANSQQAGWISDSKSKCKIWNEIPDAPESVSWVGACNSGIADGLGRLQWFRNQKLRFTYEGSVTNGRLTGTGTYTFPDGDNYQGEMVDGQRNGSGVYKWSNGEEYSGGWLHSEMNGHGKLTINNNSSYEGGFRKDLPDGEGTYLTYGNAHAGIWNLGCLREGDDWIALRVNKALCGDNYVRGWDWIGDQLAKEVTAAGFATTENKGSLTFDIVDDTVFCDENDKLLERTIAKKAGQFTMVLRWSGYGHSEIVAARRGGGGMKFRYLAPYVRAFSLCGKEFVKAD